jgi:hypothetical protein
MLARPAYRIVLIDRLRKVATDAGDRVDHADPVPVPAAPASDDTTIRGIGYEFGFPPGQIGELVNSRADRGG